MIRTIILACFLLVLIAQGNIASAADTPAADTVKEEKVPDTSAPSKEEPKEETKKEEPAAEEEELPPEARAHQKAAEEVFEDTKKIAANISPEEQKHFFILYNNYNLVGTIKMVQGDVANAVEACGRENPDMKEGLDTRLKEWKGAIDPVIKEAEANVENMVLAQDYAKPTEIKGVFKGLDKTRKLANKQIEKTPVTTKDACEYLQEKMSDTQENFIRLLRSTLMSAPQAIPADKTETSAGKDKEEKKSEPQKIEEKPIEEPESKSVENPEEKKE